LWICDELYNHLEQTQNNEYISFLMEIEAEAIKKGLHAGFRRSKEENFKGKF
jgi:type III secretory pathway lipoprotein EscJ